MHDDRADVFNELKTQLLVAAAYCKMLLAQTPETDPRHADVLEIDQATRAAVGLLDEVGKGIQ